MCRLSNSVSRSKVGTIWIDQIVLYCAATKERIGNSLRTHCVKSANQLAVFAGHEFLRVRSKITLEATGAMDRHGYGTRDQA